MARTTPQDYSEHTTDVSGRGHGPEQPYASDSMRSAPARENAFPADSTQPFGERPRTSPTQPFGERPQTSPTQPFGERPQTSPNQPFGERPRTANSFAPAADATQSFGEWSAAGNAAPGAASRATVTPPPDPESTASWPGTADQETDQDRFNSFQPDQPATEVAKPETPHVRMLPVLIGVILGAGLLVGLTFGITWLIARGSDSGNFSVSTGDCVKRSGTQAVTAKCGDADAYEVTSIVNTKEECTDPGQPYVLNPTEDNKTQVLCLKRRG